MSNLSADNILKEGPVGEGPLPYSNSKSRSAPNTPRTQEDAISTTFLPSQFMLNGEDEISKEMQIAILKERLEFTEKQLVEKDRQLEHYKQLVKTLKDVLAEVSGRRYSPATGAPPPAIARPPPGFEQQGQTPQKFPIKGRKVRSFHQEYYQPEDLEEEDPFEFSPTKKGEKLSNPSWRKPPEESQLHHDNNSSLKKEVTLPSTREVNKNNQGYRITKSVSHQALSTLTDEENQPIQPNVDNRDTTREGLRSSAPTVQKQAIEQVVGSKKLSVLKKSQSMTSVYSVLEENRLDSKFPDLEQMVGQIYALSKYQQGCRFLQKKLDDKNANNVKIILNELFDHLVELMTDPFGNYLFSKLMEHCDPPQREKVISKILPELMTTAFDMYGTQSLQKMMPFLTESQINAVIGTLRESAIALIKHNKANYLIQYCLDNLPPKHNQWIYDAVAESMEEVAKDRVGCVIVKRCIDHATVEQKQKLAEEVTRKALALVQDPFGNYVVQHILDKYPTEDQSHKLIRNLLGNITDLCTQKFSSNVVEKCLKVADLETKRNMLTEIIETEVLPQLLNDRFANFVIQTALDVAEPEQRQLLVKNILPHLGRHYSPYTKRLQKKILQV